MKRFKKSLLALSVILGIIGQIVPLKAITHQYNRIVPESLSNVFYEIEYDKYCKLIKYDIDLSNIINATLGTRKMMDIALDKAVVTLKTDTGTTLLTKGTQYYSEGNILKIDLTHPRYNVEEGKKHSINIYLPTTFRYTVSYGDESAVPDPNTYIGAFIKANNTIKVSVKRTATPRVSEGRFEEAVEIKEEWGTEENKEDEIQLTYKLMPRIL